MLIDMETVTHASSISPSRGMVELELEEECPELEDKHNRDIVLLLNMAGSIVIVSGSLLHYEKVEPDPDISEQDVFCRVSVLGFCVEISL